jgi:hypothetical protein
MSTFIVKRVAHARQEQNMGRKPLSAICLQPSAAISFRLQLLADG